MSKKIYLVACYDKNDVIEQMKEWLLALKINTKKNWKIDKEERCIYSSNERIYFKFGYEISYTQGIAFTGIVQSKCYRDFTSYELKGYYENLFLRTMRTYGKNDRFGFITDMSKRVRGIGDEH
ncbi:hypothetical protein ABM133_08980 [Enterococcus cecorum]|uniref:hypothetical protein n=1 Tax=Enterococcus cecorum TaxID=44008 RepID=UPI0032C45E55